MIQRNSKNSTFRPELEMIRVSENRKVGKFSSHEIRADFHQNKCTCYVLYMYVSQSGLGVYFRLCQKNLDSVLFQ